MLEIKINNEEMCCNNVNEIKESILQPTNLILKNCYPMEWEKDHDYTSKFFYPKLWSKCIINEKGNSEVVEGKNIYIENAKSDYSNKLKIIGESKQETTEGYNLCPNELQTTSLNGLTFTVNEDKSITVNGTATKETTVFITKNLNLETGDYYFSGCLGGSPSTYNMTIFGVTSVYNGERKSTVETNKTYSVGIVVFANQKMDNVIYKPMVTKIAGNSYEPYTGGKASPNPDYPQEIESLNGYNLFNVPEKISVTTFKDIPLFLETGKYNISYESAITEGKKIFMFLFYYQDGSTENVTLNEINKKDFILIKNTKKVTIYSKYDYQSSNNITTNYEGLMITTDENKDKPYQPYKSIEIKQTGKNLFDINKIKGSGNPLGNYASVTNKRNYLIVKNSVSGGGVFSGNKLKEIANLTIGETYYIQFKTESPNKYCYLLGANIVWAIGTSQKITQEMLDSKLYFYGKDNFEECIIKDIIISKEKIPYEPYKENIANLKNITPLRSINEIKDEFNKENTITKIKHYEFTGNENWTSYGNNCYFMYIEDKKPGYFNSKCNYFSEKRAVWVNNEYGKYSGHPTINTVYFSSLGLNVKSVEEWKQWLKNKKAEGNPVYIDYVLKEPIVKPLTAEDKTEINKIQLFEGYNNIELISNGLGNIEITYNIEKLIFAGAVKNTGNISLNPRMPKYANVEVIDFKSLLSEGDMLDFVISDKTILEAIKMIIDTISSYGFVLGNIDIEQSNEIIGAYNTQNQTAYDVFQYISEITHSIWNTRMIDENTIAIDIYNINKLPKKENIKYTNKYFCDNEIIDMNYNLSSRDYRNKQVIISDKTIASIDTKEQIFLDGYNQNFTTSQKIGVIESIYVNNLAKTFAKKSEMQIGVEADFYYEEGNNIVEFNNTYISGTKVVIFYKSIINGRQVAEDKTEINRISNQINRNGIISRFEVRNDIKRSEQLLKIANTYLELKGKEEITLNIKTKKNIFNIGDRVSFDITELAELNTEYLVKERIIKIIGNNEEIFYNYKLVSNFNAQNEINFFDNQRRKISGNIEKGSSIIRNIDLDNSINIIFSNLQFEKVSATTDNKLNSKLNSVMDK